jgi:hypothetical protein
MIFNPQIVKFKHQITKPNTNNNGIRDFKVGIS